MMYLSNFVKCESVCIGNHFDMPTNVHDNTTYFANTNRKKSNIENEIKTDDSTNLQDSYMLEYYQSKADEIVLKAKYDAFKILEEAQKKAEQIIALAKKNSDELYAKNYRLSHERGFEDGYEEGMADAKSQSESLVSELQELSQNVVNEQDNFISTSKEIIVELACEMAKKIIEDNLVQNENLLLSMFSKVVNNIPLADKITVTVANEDYQILSRNIDKLTELAKGFKYVELSVDKSREMGSLIIENPAIFIDAGINTQLNILKKEVVGTW